jgi:hypothetical protein
MMLAITSGLQTWRFLQSASIANQALHFTGQMRRRCCRARTMGVIHDSGIFRYDGQN